MYFSEYVYKREIDRQTFRDRDTDERQKDRECAYVY